MPNLTSLYIDIPAVRPGTIGAYAFAFLCTTIATAVGVAINPYLEGVPFVTFPTVVIVTTFISGLGAGLFLYCPQDGLGHVLRASAGLVFLR